MHTENKNKSLSIITRLYQESKNAENFNKIKEIKMEIGIPTLLQRKNQTAYSKQNNFFPTFEKRQKSSQLIRPDSKSTMSEMINYKKKILLAKISEIEKKEHIKEMKNFVSFEERQLMMRIEDFKDNSNIVRSNFEQFKKAVNNLESQVELCEDTKVERLKVYQETRNKILQKESEIKVINEKISEITACKAFTDYILNFYSEQNDDKNVCSQDSKNEEKTPDKIKEPVFLTSGNNEAQNVSHLSKALSFYEINLDFKEFQTRLQKIENNNFILFDGLQDQEIKFEENLNSIMAPQVDAENQLKLLKQTHLNMLKEEKKLQQIKNEKAMMLERCYGEIIKVDTDDPFQEFELRSLEQLKKSKSENCLFGQNSTKEITKSCKRILASFGITFENEVGVIELLKLIELIFESYRIKADVLHKHNKELYLKLSKDYFVLIKKDFFKGDSNQTNIRNLARRKKDCTLREKIHWLKTARSTQTKTFIKFKNRIKIDDSEEIKRLEEEKYFN